MEIPGPAQRYRQAVDRGEIEFDQAQSEAVQLLQELFVELTRPESGTGLVRRIFFRQQIKKHRGIYFWGGVGRGKTFLMDLFYESLPIENKRRMHFHRFMRHVHRKMRELQGQANPLRTVARQFAGEAKVLCFDEFYVSDITDAMILANLLESLFDHGVVLVATSNVEPSQLYENGLQRRKFLPAIELIAANTKILNVDGGVDYRLRALEAAEIYHTPLDEAADISLQRSFEALSPDHGEPDLELEIEGRRIQSRLCGDGIAWFDFAAVCEGPRSQNDYIELAMIFQTVLVSNVPRFTVKKEDAARRFISLVDEFYDHNVKLILSAEVPVLELYQGEKLAFEFQRTESRLQEMQSHEYLAREHRP
ncbi:MAG: cell division protein ZapE, partial [Pseudomonadales bacterium]